MSLTANVTSLNIIIVWPAGGGEGGKWVTGSDQAFDLQRLVLSLVRQIQASRQSIASRLGGSEVLRHYLQTQMHSCTPHH